MHFPFAGHRPHEAAPEDEDMPGERVTSQRVLHLRGQTVEATTHIGDASDDPDSGTSWQRYHREPPFIIMDENSQYFRCQLVKEFYNS